MHACMHASSSCINQNPKPIGISYTIHCRTDQSLIALYPGGIPRSEPPSCEAPQQPTIYDKFGLIVIFRLMIWPYGIEFPAFWFLLFWPYGFGIKALPPLSTQVRNGVGLVMS